MRYLDTHTHVVSDDPIKYPLAPIGGVQSDWSKERPTSGDDIVKAMDSANVEKAIVVHTSTAYGFDNRLCADSVKEHSHRLYGVGSIDFLGSDNVRDLSRLIDEEHFIGCRIYMAGNMLFSTATRLSVNDMDQVAWKLDDPQTFAAWGFAQERDLPVVIAMQQSAIPQLKGVIKQFPRLRIVIDNAGRPNLDGGPPYANAAEVFSLADHENVFLKIMPAAFERAAKLPGGGSSMMRALFDYFGLDRIAWGSNFPGTEGTMQDLIAYSTVHTDQLTDRERESFFYHAAAKIYPSLSPSS